MINCFPVQLDCSTCHASLSGKTVRCLKNAPSSTAYGSLSDASIKKSQTSLMQSMAQWQHTALGGDGAKALALVLGGGERLFTALAFA